MKRLLTSFLFLGIFFGIQAQGTCDRAFNKAVSLYNSGKYKDARMQFEWCRSHCKDRSDATYKGWVEKCDAGAKVQADLYQKQRRAQAESAAKEAKGAQEREEIIQQENQKRKERLENNKFIYLSVSNAVQGNFENIEYELEDNLYDINHDLKFTRDTLEAFWFVRVVVNIYGDKSNSGNSHYYYVEADIEIEDVLSAQIRRARVLKKDGTMTIPAERAQEWVANKIYNTQRESFYNEILNAITKYISQ